MLQHPETAGFLIDGFPRELDQGYQFEQDVINRFLLLDQIDHMHLFNSFIKGIM